MKNIKNMIPTLLFILFELAFGILLISSPMTAQMAPATLPMVYFIAEGQEVNLLHGYTDEMDVSHVRSSILPVGNDREISFAISTYGQNVSRVKFEVRNIDGNGLVESTDVADYREISDKILGTFQLKDLITAGKEYMLVMLVNTGNEDIRYYTRIVWTRMKQDTILLTR